MSYFSSDNSRTGIVWLDGRETGTGRDEHDHHGFMTLRAAMIAADGTLEPARLIDDSVCDCCQTAGGTTGCFLPGQPRRTRPAAGPGY